MPTKPCVRFLLGVHLPKIIESIMILLYCSFIMVKKQTVFTIFITSRLCPVITSCYSAVKVKYSKFIMFNFVFGINTYFYSVVI